MSFAQLLGCAQVPAAADGEQPTSRPITPDDLADLVEYSFGDASTKWGKMRIEDDDHPAIYNWSYIELGNVCAMRAAGYSYLLLSPCAFSWCSGAIEDVLSWRKCLIAWLLACLPH